VPRKDEPLIRRAADAAMEFTETLPSYVCTEQVTRMQSESTPANFQPIDVVTMEVLYTDGREDYRNIQINGKKTVKKIEETGGAWSTGEFGTVLVNLFNPATGATFHFRRDSRAGGVMAKMYDFEVTREGFPLDHSHRCADLRSGLRGFGVDRPGHRARAAHRDGRQGLPRGVSHGPRGIGHRLPVHPPGRSQAVPAAGACGNLELPARHGPLLAQRDRFPNYHKYTGESTITFGAPTKDKEKE
jgi:hypothetical protein